MEKKMVPKPTLQRINDLASHSRLLRDSCHRFSQTYNFDEIRNIGVQLRVLVGSGKGSGLLFGLAEESNEEFSVTVLNQYGVIKIQEIEEGTNRILQTVERRALLTQVQLIGRLPIVFSENSAQPLYKTVNLKEWITEGFLLDWEVPQENATPEMVRFTPQYLINRYAGQEGAHSDKSFGTFGQSIETLTMNYVRAGQTYVVPIVYEYLFQIGLTVSDVALKYSDDLRRRHGNLM